MAQSYRRILVQPFVKRAETIAKLIQENNWTQEKAAAKLGITQPVVSKYLFPMRLTPDVRRRLKLDAPQHEYLEYSAGFFLSQFSHEDQEELARGVALEQSSKLLLEADQLAWLKKTVRERGIRLVRKRGSSSSPLSSGKIKLVPGKYRPETREDLKEKQGIKQRYPARSPRPTSRPALVSPKKIPPAPKAHRVLPSAKAQHLVFNPRRIPPVPEDLAGPSGPERPKFITPIVWDERSGDYRLAVLTWEEYLNRWDRSLFKFQRENLPKPEHLPNREEVEGWIAEKNCK